jgi:hypothetical protein
VADDGDDRSAERDPGPSYQRLAWLGYGDAPGIVLAALLVPVVWVIRAVRRRRSRAAG